MSKESAQIVQRLWSYCNILRDDGLSYPDYVEQLTYLLFLKMADEQSKTSVNSPKIIPEDYSWQSLVNKSGKELHDHYWAILRRLSAGQGMLGVIFHEAKNKISDPEKLKLLVVDLIDKRIWSALDADVKGDAYEGLLEKNAQDTKSGAGQYFTPRPVIRAVVQCVRPQIGETIYDPACGTAGFLLAAHEYILNQNPNLSEDLKNQLRLKTFHGVELVNDVTRLGAMNLLLHGIGPLNNEEGEVPIVTRDSLSKDLGDRYSVILTNPPFGKKSSITAVKENGTKGKQALTILRPDFFASTSNKQLNFIQHINTSLEINGRAAVIVPDNVLFEGGAGEIIRRRLLQENEVHTLLRLPSGIFYASGIKTNVLFFDHRPPNPDKQKLWVYDLRTNMHFTLRTKRLETADLTEFINCYNPEDRKKRKATWSSKNPEGRWRDFDYKELLDRDKCNWDLSWLDNEGKDDLSTSGSPDEIAALIMEDLQTAITQLSEIAIDLK
jgi:type I restriction enzyme M protein